ncbi:MAG: hypothetical protein ACW976_03265, partial [Candidatus Ranarchaeia archaeon]
MQIRIDELIPSDVYPIEENTILSESDFHRASTQEKVIAIKLADSKGQSAGLLFKGLTKIEADLLIHSEYGAQGDSIVKSLPDMLLLSDEFTIQSIVNQITPITATETRTQAQEWARTELTEYTQSSSYYSTGKSLESEVSKSTTLIQSRSAQFTLIKKGKKLISINHGQILIRQGE